MLTSSIAALESQACLSLESHASFAVSQCAALAPDIGHSLEDEQSGPALRASPDAAMIGATMRASAWDMGVLLDEGLGNDCWLTTGGLHPMVPLCLMIPIEWVLALGWDQSVESNGCRDGNIQRIRGFDQGNLDFFVGGVEGLGGESWAFGAEHKGDFGV